MKGARIDHIGLTVSSLDAAVEVFEKILETKAFGLEHREEDRVKLGFVPLADSVLQLLEHWGEARSDVGAYFRAAGPGQVHVAIEVADIRGTIAALRAAGVCMFDDPPHGGARGTLTAFINPVATNGLLTELVERQKDGAATESGTTQSSARQGECSG